MVCEHEPHTTELKSLRLSFYLLKPIYMSLKVLCSRFIYNLVDFYVCPICSTPRSQTVIKFFQSPAWQV